MKNRIGNLLGGVHPPDPIHGAEGLLGLGGGLLAPRGDRFGGLAGDLRVDEPGAERVGLG